MAEICTVSEDWQARLGDSIAHPIIVTMSNVKYPSLLPSLEQHQKSQSTEECGCGFWDGFHGQNT
jgi:hypothetical protein